MEQKIITKKSIIKRALATCVIVCATQARAEDFTLSVDKYFSPYMGADWMIAGLRGYEALDDILFSGTAGQMCAQDTFIRTGKLLIDYTVSNFAMVLQHEYFGHGARVREFHLSDVSYRINVFSGTTFYSGSGFDQLNVNAKAAIASGGVEATSILAQEFEQLWLASNKIDRRDAMMYLVNSFDQTVYIFGTSGAWFHPDNDAQQYINQVNGWHALNEPALTGGDLRLRAGWDWLDPMLYLSAFSIFNYLFYGDPYINFTTWHIGDMRFMPTTRMLLAPWGPELQLKINLHTPQERYIGIYLRTGRTGGVNSYGVDLHVNPIGTAFCFTFSNKLSAWYQPHLLNTPTIQNSGSKYGFAEFLRAAYQVNKYTSAWGELGYKTSGYLQGTPLSGNVVWRLGVTFSLDVNPKGASKVCEPITFPVGPCDVPQPPPPSNCDSWCR